jgi:hypothetical protein
MKLTAEQVKDTKYIRSLTHEQLVDAVIYDSFQGGKYDDGDPPCAEKLREELMRRLEGRVDGTQETLDVDALPIAPITAISHWNSLTDKIESLCNNPRIVAQKEMQEIADQLLTVVEFLQQLSNPYESQIKSLLFCHNGKVSLKVEVVEGAVYINIRDPKDQLLMLLSLPQESSVKLAHVVLSHSQAKADPLSFS